jgi:hypothetical protein
VGFLVNPKPLLFDGNTRELYAKGNFKAIVQRGHKDYLGTYDSFNVFHKLIFASAPELWLHHPNFEYRSLDMYALGVTTYYL